MRTRPLAKHQKLILQCYPAGRGVDKRPNASELSYLLYYVSTRRVKLSKVGAFLEKNTKTDIYKARSGNVAVTLDILKALIERVSDDLNLFAWNVVGILSTVLTSNDLALCQRTCDVFMVFCNYHDGALLTGDPDYVKAFHNLVYQYIDISSNASGPNRLQWKYLGIHAARSVASSTAVAVPTGHALSSRLVPLVLSVLEDDNKQDEARIIHLRNKVDEKTSATQSTRYLSATVGSQQQHKRNTSSVFVSSTQASEDNKEKQPEQGGRTNDGGENEDEDGDDDEEHGGSEEFNERLQVTAMEALKSFFDTTAHVQLKHSTQVVVKYIIDSSNGDKNGWPTTLVQIVAKWTPVQLRFVILSSLVDLFVGQPISAVQSQMKLTCLISSLLSSSVNMVGLSVMDVQRLLISHQHKVIRHQIDNKDVEESKLEPLILRITDCIASITTHIYYADQISDMVHDILARTHHHHRASSSYSPSDVHPIAPRSRSSSSLSHLPESVQNNSSSSNNGERQPSHHTHNYSQPARDKALITDLNNVRAILRVSKSTQGLDSNKIGISAWDGTQSLIHHDNRDVRFAFASAFITYLKNGVTEDDKHLKVHGKFSAVKGTLGRLIYQLYLAVVDTAVQKKDFIIVNHILSNMIDYLGINAIVRILPFMLMLQDLGISVEHGENPKPYHLEQGIGQSCLALATLSNIATRLEIDQLVDTISKQIKSRKYKKNSLWYKGIDTPIENELSQDLRQKETFMFQPAEYSDTKQALALDREIIKSELKIKDFPEDLKHSLFEDVKAPEDPMSGVTTSDSNTDNDGTFDNILVVKARSLKQLRNGYHPSSGGGNRPPTVYSHEYNDDININKQDRKLSTAAMSNTNMPPSPMPQRNISNYSIDSNGGPRVSYLRRVASGTLNGDATANEGRRKRAGSVRSRRRRAGSLQSTSSNGPKEEGDRTPTVEDTNNNNKNNALDVTSFLSNLNVHSTNERGRLV